MAILSFALTLIWDARADAQTRATATGTREDTSGGTVKEKSFDPGAIAKTIVDEASGLKKDAAEWGQKLQELEADLKNNENVDGTVKDVDESLVVVRAVADRLAPNSETRATLRKQEDAIRDLAIRAEVHSDQAIRKTASYFQQKTAELHAVNRSLEEIRIRLVTEIDRLQELKVRLEFNPAAAQNREALKEGEVNLDHIKALTADAQQLASDLNNFGGTVPVAATTSEAAKPADPRYVRALDEIKRDYGKISHPSEAARAYYITRLVRLHEEAVRLNTDAWQAIDAEIKQHPAPNDSNSKALSSLLIGKWESPRHDHLYRADGTWTMIPVEPDVTHGTWRIEGNQYFNTYIDTDATHPPQTFQYTIILITKRDFVFIDQEVVFYETRLK
jgi:hypothetical protein